MLRPVIFIGCGGSGQKAVRYVRDAVRRQLEHSGWTREMPSAWQFIGLDTLTTQESPTEIPTIPERDFLTLSGGLNHYNDLYLALEAKHNGHQGRPDLLSGWLPDPNQVEIPLKDGAGRVRAIGRAAGLFSLQDTLHSRLKKAFERAQSGGQELYEAGQYLGVDAALGSDVPEPLVVVCSSMAGGTGAGIALDVVDLLRSSYPQGRYPCLVLFANDIFDLTDKHPMAANSLGLMSELLAAYWSYPGEIDTPLPIKGVLKPGVGPHSVFVLGRSGLSGANLGSTAGVYQAVGEALSTWVISSIVQERIHNFINVNWADSAKDNVGGYPFGEEQMPGAVSSFGAAKVTVGRDRFARWADDKLAREVLEALVEGHLWLNTLGVADQNLSEMDLIRAEGERYAETVYQAVPLAGAGPVPVPGCEGAPRHFASDDQVIEISNRVRADMAFTPDQSASGGQWRSELEKIGRRLGEEVEREARNTQDGDWCQNMVLATCKAASQVAARSSLKVATAALNFAADKLNPAEIHRVRDEASDAHKKFNVRVRAGLEKLSNAQGKIGGEDQILREAAELIAQGIAFRWKGLRYDAAAKVMEQAGDQVLRVMADSLKAAVGQAGAALATDEVKAWPRNGGGVSRRYLPSNVELPLESHEVWEDLLSELCQEATEDNVSFGSRPTDPVRYRLVAGTPLVAGEDDIQPLIQPSSTRWSPGHAAGLICEAGKEEVAKRVRQWTSAPGSKFARVVGEGLESYLSENDPHTGNRNVDHADRLETFRLQLGQAKNKSEPLVNVNHALGFLDRQDVSLETVCSSFPFGEGHPAANAAREIVGEEAYETGSLDVSSVLISQYIKHPLNPLAIRSFTDPIMEALAENQRAGERAATFWAWRRGRRLDGFVPLPRPVLESIIRGFAVARLCGYITVEIDRPVRITAGPDAVEFPWPLLSQLSSPNDVLPGLLEGFSLTFGMVSGEGVSAYEGYKRLYELGEPSGHERLHGDLEAVLDTGLPPYATVVGEQPKASGATPEERQENAQQYLEANLAWFDEQEERRGTRLFHQSTDGRAEPGVPTMELAELLSKCYSQLLESMRAQRHGGSVV